jgi:hypothetical protein
MLNVSRRSSRMLNCLTNEEILMKTGRESNLTQQFRHKEMTQSTARSHSLQQEVKNILHVDDHMASQDLQTILSQAKSVDTKLQGRAHWVLRTPRFMKWIQSRDSDVLSINGNLDGFGMARYSPLSLLPATLIQSLLQQPHIYVVYYFCGMHNSVMDDLAGPVGLIRSLNAQLLSFQQVGLDFVQVGQWGEGLQSLDLQTLCRLFRRLVSQLPDMMLFCVLDGVSLFETDLSRNDAAFVLRKLIDLSMDEDLDCHFKLLLTSATMSRIGKELLSETNILSIPENAGNGMLLTDRTIARDVIPAPTEKGLSHEEDDYNLYDHGYE